MSDDFMTDINNAVDNGGQVETPEAPEVAQPRQKTTPQEVKPNIKEPSSVADELSTMFENADPHKEETKEKSTQKTETDPKEKSKEKVEDVENPKDVNTQKTRTQRKGNEKLLDTFLNEDEQGNLVNAEGEVIALAGKSRTYYEGLKNEARKQRKAATDLAVTHMQLSQQFKALYDEYKEMSVNGVSPVQSIVKETGFSESEATEAVNLLRQYKREPLEAIKNMLTQAKMNGIDISKLGANISVDPAFLRNSMQELLDERLKPISDKADQDKSQQEALQEAQQFLDDYPEARRFSKAVAHAKQRFPQMSLGEIWLRLRRELENNPQQQQQQRRQSSTKHRNESRPQRRPAKKTVAAPKRDYTSMSFDEIANSIVEDNS